MMLQFVNKTDFTANQFILLDRQGRDCLLVVGKACFTVNGIGKVEKTKYPIPLTLTDQYSGEQNQTYLQDATDITLNKPGSDVAVIGYAYSQRPGSTCSLIDLSVGSVCKKICVIGERRWKKSDTVYQPTPAQPFERIPLRWEYAFGGFEDLRNPLGVGRFNNAKSSPEDLSLPNFEHPEQRIQTPEDKPTPMCTGFIPPAWSSRQQFAGTYDEAWQTQRMPLLPEDFDERFFHCVSPDQVVAGHLQGNEHVDLTGVCWHSELKFCLPKLSLVCQISDKRGESGVPMHIDKLVIDAEMRCFTLVWTGMHRIREHPREINKIVLGETSLAA